MSKDVQAESSTAETVTVEPEEQSETAETTESEESSTSNESESTIAKPGEQPASEAGNKNTRGKKGAEERVKQLLQENKTLKRQLRGRTAPPEKPLEKPKKPVQDDFESYDDFQAALDAYPQKVAQYEIQRDRLERQKQSQAAAEKERDEQIKQVWNTRAAKTLERHPDADFKQAITDVDPNAALEQFLLDSEIGPDVVLHLQANPDLAEELRELEPMATVRRALALEAELLAEIQGMKPKPKPKPPLYVGANGGVGGKKSAAEVLYG